MNSYLKSFFENSGQRETIKTFLNEMLELEAIDRVFKKQNTEGIADAKIVLDKAFAKLEEMYGKLKDKEIDNAR